MSIFRVKYLYFLGFSIVITPFCVVGAIQCLNASASNGRAKVVSGIITSFVQHTYGRYEYEFYVNNVRYTGQDHLASLAKKGEDVGRRVRVYYDSENPSVSNLSGFEEKSRGIYRYVLIWFAFLIAPLIINGKLVSKIIKISGS